METPKQRFDRTMLKTWSMLKRDFRSFALEVDPLTKRFDLPDARNAHELRSIVNNLVVPYTVDVHYFKRATQLRDFCKRYIFEEDIYKSEDLISGTIQKFLSTQTRLQNSIPSTLRSRAVIMLARKKIKSVLGEFSEQEVIASSRFSRNATTLSPRSKAGIDLKLTGPISGSADHIEWFEKTILSTDGLLRSFCGPLHEVKSLGLALAPKKHDSLRTITPNTTIGSYYTHGLGKVIENRIRISEMGIDLSRQQDRHRAWIKKYSLSLSHVTADLSAASDSFTNSLINALVPRKWYNALKFGRLRHVSFNGSVTYLSSFMAMGIGFTFPLQTLLFWAILKSIQELSNVAGKVSVFGDDLIYPRQMHNFVVGVFSDLGFLLNQGKTFVHEPFRESCGSDYYCGFDVRSAMPKAPDHIGHGLRFAMELYKLINTLLRRWDEYEIPSTLEYLLKEVQTFSSIYRVPYDFPDHSGLKYDLNSEWYWHFKPTTFSPLTQCTVFEFLAYTPKRRAVKNQIPYLWEWLRSKSVGEEEVDPWADFEPDLFGSPSEMLKWVPHKWKTVYLNKVPGRPRVKAKKLYAFAPKKDSLSASLTKGLTPSNLRVTTKVTAG